jgi:hypothetical protein
MFTWDAMFWAPVVRRKKCAMGQYLNPALIYLSPSPPPYVLKGHDFWRALKDHCIFKAAKTGIGQTQILQKPEQGAQLNRSKAHTLTGACRTPKPG